MKLQTDLQTGYDLMRSTMTQELMRFRPSTSRAEMYRLSEHLIVFYRDTLFMSRDWFMGASREKTREFLATLTKTELKVPGMSSERVISCWIEDGQFSNLAPAGMNIAATARTLREVARFLPNASPTRDNPRIARFLLDRMVTMANVQQSLRQQHLMTALMLESDVGIIDTAMQADDKIRDLVAYANEQIRRQLRLMVNVGALTEARITGEERDL